ncbi:MAG: HEAT repeat domain-containing protein [Sedimentisphaerales bacterium]|jgi:HEAT repeat protein
MENEIKKLLLRIHSCKSEARVAAVKAFLEERLLSETREKLIERINSSHDDVEIELSKFALWRKELDTSYEGLLQVIRTSSENDKIREAAALLGEKGYKQAVEPLISLLVNTSDDSVRDGAALGLRELGDQRALYPLVRMIKAHPEDCYTLAYALETLDCRTILEFLVDTFLSQPNNYMLWCSVYECVKKSDMSTVPKDIIEICKEKLESAIATTNNEKYANHLQQLLEAFQGEM